MESKRNPAVLVGLAGLATMETPLVAQASPLTDAASFVFDSPMNALAVGLVSGALASGAVSGLVCRLVVSQLREDIDDLRRQNDSLELTAIMKSAKHLKGATGGGAAPIQAMSSVDVEDPSFAGRPAEGASSNPGVTNPLLIGSHVAHGAQSVARRIRTRREADMMDGLPVITRADGSVADLGADWWNTSMGLGAATKVESAVSDDGDSLAIPSEFFAKTGKQRLVDAAREASSNNATAEFTKKDISERLAFVDEGLFPESHGTDGIAEDDWASALRSMDDRFNLRQAKPKAPVYIPFSDVVGGQDTLDEPESLGSSAPTAPLKPLAVRPRTAGLESRVNRLVGEGLEYGLAVAKTGAEGDDLRLIEGGASTTVLKRSAKKVSAAKTAELRGSAVASDTYAKHLAWPVAKEA